MAEISSHKCVCGAEATHHTTRVLFKGWEEIYQCCACYVRAGNSPADWHRGCMKTWNEILKESGVER